MKNIFFLAVICMVTNTFGQTIPNFDRGIAPGIPGVNINSDTTLKVLYLNKSDNHQLPAYYVNGRFVNPAFFYLIDPKVIESIQVNKDSLEIENVMYYGKIEIKTKSSYRPQIISLIELKNKYTNLKSEPAFFVVDGEIVTAGFDKYVVDENVLWRIIVDKVENKNFNLTFIKLLTKSEENLKKIEIRIRGTEVAGKE